MFCHYGDCTPREVSAMTGLNESTVRVHLFRAARKLRGLLGGQPDPARVHTSTKNGSSNCYLAERGGEPVDPRVAEHLADCPSCSSRYAELAAFMDTLRRDGDADADADFTPSASAPAAADRQAAVAGRPARPRAQFPGRISPAIDRPLGDAPHAALGGRRGGGRPVHRRRVGASYQWTAQTQGRQRFSEAESLVALVAGGHTRQRHARRRRR